ncbi:hypothetical protein D3C81_1600320 [compost metagenome]
MKQEQHRDIDRQPRRIKKRKQAVPGHELAQPGQIAERLGRRVLATAVQCALETGPVDIPAEQDVEPGADTNHDPRAYPLQQAHRHQQEGQNDSQHGQRRQAAARDYPSVDLKHIEGRDQHQCVDEQAEKTHRYETVPAGPEGYLQAVFGRTAYHLGADNLMC